MTRMRTWWNSNTAPDIIGPYHITGHLNHKQAKRSDCNMVALYCYTEWMEWRYKRLSSPLIAVYQVTKCAAAAAAAAAVVCICRILHAWAWALGDGRSAALDNQKEDDIHGTIA